MPSNRRHSRGNKALWAAACAAVIVHGTVLGSALALGVGGGSKANLTIQRVLQQAQDAVELQTSCTGDVLLATSARAAMCFAPWRGGEIAACQHDVQMSMWMDLSGCQATPEALASTAPISLLKQREVQKLTPIDPEPLLEELRQEEAKQKPIPPPQLQQQQPPPPPPPASPPRSRPEQVVEVVKPREEKVPTNSRFVSEYDVSVENQRVARGSEREDIAKKASPEELQAKQNPQEASMRELPKDDPGKNPKAPDVPGTLSMRNPGAVQPSEAPQEQRTRGTQATQQGPLVADGFVPRHGDGAIEQQQRERGELSHGQGGAGGGSPQTPNLKPTPEALQRALGGGSVDHLDDVENGDENSLNSRKVIYASFFNRMKRAVAQNWDPATVWRRADPQGSVYGFKTRITSVRVSLTPNGALAKIVVTDSSGVQDLDDEAVRSFHAAAPFPNPPDQLVEKSGLITFGFSFYFEIGAPREAWRVIRSM